MSRPRQALLALGGIAAALVGACEPVPATYTEPGVSMELASYRSANLSDVVYDIGLTIPESQDERIRGSETISFKRADGAKPVVLDFDESKESVLAVRVDGNDVAYTFLNGHIVVPAEAFRQRDNQVEIEFLAGDNSLNRNKEFLYTLFVPDRARFAFPCFDQPNLKARYILTLDLPAAWQAVANGGLRTRVVEGDRALMTFAETEPISTYLFSFVAGDFSWEEAERNGRTLRFYHRETDEAKVERNKEAIFDLHATALDWLEEYTDVDYPFNKFEFVLIPSFQYSGMEHPGAILYRASRLLLDESATQSDRLGRASLIAHETAHMWFGDLVTMEWFDDVWTKEVFANFMAAKIVHPSFPHINHELRFLLAHYPAAYGVDRTEGANPIRQPLENLNEAGSLYGAIIYQKAPVVMKQLEELIGEEELREGLEEYLKTFAFANATWPDLIEILDRRYAGDLASWSSTWVEESRRPTVTTDWVADADGALTALTVSQSDPGHAGRVWKQRLDITLAYADRYETVPLQLDAVTRTADAAVGLPAPDYVLPDGRGVAYGLFLLDDVSQRYLLEHTPSLDDELRRGIAWITLWDAMLEGRVTPESIIDLAARTLEVEADELIVQRVLSYLQAAYWRYLSADERAARATEVEALLWRRMESAAAPSLKAAFFNAYRALALTPSASQRLRELWGGELEIRGLNLSEQHYTGMAQALALREVEGWEAILDDQFERIENPDRRERFAFVRPSLSADIAVRDSFFESLKRPTNREHEPWVLGAVRYLHHPLRAAQSERYILPSLELLREIQATGDIFFPKGWLDATLAGHNTRSAAAIVSGFLDDHPDYPARLRGKILQSADPLFRAAAILESE